MRQILGRLEYVVPLGQEHERLPGRIASFFETLGEKHHRRNADSAADQKRARPFRMQLEAAADRSQD